MNKKVFRQFLIILLLFLVLALLFVILKSCTSEQQINKSLDCFSQNEKEVIELSEKLLKDNTFSKEGRYLISLNNGEVKLELFDTFGASKGQKDISQKYSEMFSHKWLDKNTKIQIDHIYDSSISDYVNAVTFKKDVLFKENCLWIFYGDKHAFPLDYYDASPRDVTEKLTDRLYYFIPY